VVTVKEWNIENYFELKRLYSDKYKFNLIVNKDDLTIDYLNEVKPRYIFFPHWSWIIKKEIFNMFNCVVFHMTDLPYGRGGSPFQNLIINKVYDTKISALRVASGLDTGDIYLKEDFNISVGSAEENFMQLSRIIFQKMIPNFLNNELVGVPQAGEVVEFKRRKHEDSDIASHNMHSIIDMYDSVRMLDAEGYPKAYVDVGRLKIEFSEVHLRSNKLVGRFEVIKNE
jgi:methionyl-tRNA formyltransferase